MLLFFTTAYRTRSYDNRFNNDKTKIDGTAYTLAKVQAFKGKVVGVPKHEIPHQVYDAIRQWARSNGVQTTGGDY